jgi:hypothetical protein
MRLYTLRQDAFAAVDDEATAYWLGFLFADGSVTRRGGVTLVLQERDTDHVRAFAAFLGSNAPIASLTRQPGARLSIHSVRLARDLRALGCVPNKAAEALLRPPSLPNHLFPHFARGYFDGDGSAYIASGVPTVSFCGNAEFLVYLQSRIVMHARIDGVIRPHSKSMRAHYLTYRGMGKTLPLREWLYAGATVFLTRKRARMAEFPTPKRPVSPAFVQRNAATVGHVSEETVRRYIEAQKGV